MTPGSMPRSRRAERLRFRRLEPSDARRVARLERVVHRPQSLSGKRRLSEELREAEQGESNLSLGLFDGARMVGVILAYALPRSVRIEPDRASEADPYVIYLADLSLLRGYRRHLTEFVGRFTELARQELPGIGIEAHSFEPEMRLWRRFARASRELGFELAAVERLERHESGFDLFYVRWDAVDASGADACALPVERRYRIGDVEYQLRVIRCVRHWERLASVWDELLERVPDASALQSHAYLLAWWQCFGHSRRLFILTFWRGPELCAIAPLETTTELSFVGYERRLGFIGSRWEVDRPTLLFPSGFVDGVELLRRVLLEPDAPWDSIHAYEQGQGSALFEIVRPFVEQQSVLQRVVPDSSCPYLDLDRSFEEYFSGRSRDFRRRMRSMYRKLAARGNLELERVSTDPEVRTAFEEYLEIERRSWKHGTDAAVSSSERLQFYRALLDRLAPRGELHVLLLRLDGRAIAGSIALAHGSRYASMQITHDRVESDFSPGTVLEYLEIQDCFAGVWKEYDFLGGFLSNKQRWSSSWRETVQLDLERRTALSRLRHFWKVSLLPRASSVLQSLGLLERAHRVHGRLLDALRRLALGRGHG